MVVQKTFSTANPAAPAKWAYQVGEPTPANPVPSLFEAKGLIPTMLYAQCCEPCAAADVAAAAGTAAWGERLLS
jgi:hypothetical protein